MQGASISPKGRGTHLHRYYGTHRSTIGKRSPCLSSSRYLHRTHRPQKALHPGSGHYQARLRRSLSFGCLHAVGRSRVGVDRTPLHFHSNRRRCSGTQKAHRADSHREVGRHVRRHRDVRRHGSDVSNASALLVFWYVYQRKNRHVRRSHQREHVFDHSSHRKITVRASRQSPRPVHRPQDAEKDCSIWSF